MRSIYLSVLVAATLAISACAAGSGSSSAPASAPPSTGQPTASGATGSPPSGVTVQVTIGTDSAADLKFDPGELTVKAGADVRVTFENRATVPHNLTFQAPINVASAAVVDPGTSATLQFTAPEPGEYAFVCTIHPGMGGKLIVAGS